MRLCRRRHAHFAARRRVRKGDGSACGDGVQRVHGRGGKTRYDNRKQTQNYGRNGCVAYIGKSPEFLRRDVGAYRKKTHGARLLRKIRTCLEVFFRYQRRSHSDASGRDCRCLCRFGGQSSRSRARKSHRAYFGAEKGIRAQTGQLRQHFRERRRSDGGSRVFRGETRGIRSVLYVQAEIYERQSRKRGILSAGKTVRLQCGHHGGDCHDRRLRSGRDIKTRRQKSGTRGTLRGSEGA